VIALKDGIVPREDAEQVLREICLPYGFKDAGKEICSMIMETAEAVELACISCDMAKLLTQSLEYKYNRASAKN
jgi:hypothetical protein